MKTAVLYARYSSSKQREVSINDQLRVCRDYCQRENIEIINTYTDSAMTGTNDARPGFQSMIANAPESDYVLVYMMDRFSRDEYDAPLYKMKLHQKGVRVISATEYIPDTPEGILTEKLLEGIAAYYSKDLARKITRGMEGNAMNALSNGYHKFGYDVDPVTRQYVVNPSEADIVKEVFSRYINGEGMARIASTLAKRGLKTTRGNAANYNLVRRIIKDECYTGLYRWADVEVSDGMPAIIDREVWECAQQIPRRRRPAQEKQDEFPLSGKLYCAKCGNPMHGTSGYGRHGNKYCYYRCPKNSKCRSRAVPKDLVENTLSEAVCTLVDDPKIARKVARFVIEASENKNNAAALEVLDEKIKQAQTSIRNIEKAIEEGVFTKGLSERLKTLQSDLDVYSKERSRIEKEQAIIDEEGLTAFLMHGFSAKDKDITLNGFINRVYLFDDYMVATMNFRNRTNELAEVRIALEQAKQNATPSSEGVALSAYGGASLKRAEPTMIRLRHAIGLIIPFQQQQKHS